MRRRTFLASGLALAGGAALGGCLDQDGGGDGGDVDLPGAAPDPEITRAGLARDTEDVPAPDVDLDALETYTDYAEDVPLLPNDAAYDWYRRRDARFVDARGLGQYQASHVAGAVHSPAPDGYAQDDPVEAWPEAERIVTYCGCPHTLSSARASSLIADGREAVFALADGFTPWVQDGYPIASSDGGEAVLGEAHTVRGSVDSSHAGKQVWVRHGPPAHLEHGEIAADGSFAVTIRFADVGPESPLTVETPAWTETAPLAEWTDDTAR